MLDLFCIALIIYRYIIPTKKYSANENTHCRVLYFFTFIFSLCGIYYIPHKIYETVAIFKTMPRSLTLCISMYAACIFLFTIFAATESKLLFPIIKRASAFTENVSNKKVFKATFRKNHNDTSNYLIFHLFMRFLLFSVYLIKIIAIAIVDSKNISGLKGFVINHTLFREVSILIIINLLYHIAAYLIIRHIFYDTLYKLRGSEPQQAIS